MSDFFGSAQSTSSETELTIRMQAGVRHVINVVKTIVNMAEFVHVPHFDISYSQCVFIM